MFADELTHPSTPAFQDRPEQPASNAYLSELPTLLYQSLVMWEHIFAGQDMARSHRLQAAPAESGSADALTTPEAAVQCKEDICR